MSKDMIVVSRKPIHPGEFLREDYMPELDLSVAKLAEKLGVTRQTVNDIVRERRNLSPEVSEAWSLVWHYPTILDEYAG